MAKFQNLKYYSTILSYHSGMLNHPIILYLLVCCYADIQSSTTQYFLFYISNPTPFSTPLNNFAILKNCKKKMDIDYVDIMTVEILSKIQDLIYWSVRFCIRRGWGKGVEGGYRYISQLEVAFYQCKRESLTQSTLSITISIREK